MSEDKKIVERSYNDRREKSLQNRRIGEDDTIIYLFNEFDATEERISTDRRGGIDRRN